jgi:2-polyprenyl-3-methyl-5-hydroxy-6-metoxy-1,4-benzoquinol methylase
MRSNNPFSLAVYHIACGDRHAMNVQVQAQLLALNRQFYAAVGQEFDRTRQSLPTGMVQLAQHLRRDQPQRVLDAGCGNGRFARALAQVGAPVVYVGVDADEQLLRLAAEQTQGLPGIATTFHAVDLADAAWVEQVAGAGPFDAVVCLAVLHHFPGMALRQRLVRELAGLLASQGLLALSTWQFGEVDRFVGKQADWGQIGLTVEDVEPGDALLPWNQGVHALRYVHQLDLAEIEALAAAAHLRVVESFRADGKEGNLNLYTVLAPAKDSETD